MVRVAKKRSVKPGQRYAFWMTDEMVNTFLDAAQTRYDLRRLPLVKQVRIAFHEWIREQLKNVDSKELKRVKDGN